MLIIAMLAGMAIPRLSRGSGGASRSAMLADLNVVHNAITRYQAEHIGALPGPTAAHFVSQLTLFTEVTGKTNPKRTGPYVFGPYLVTMPRIPIGPNRGSPSILIDPVNNPPTPNPASGDGWVYNPNSGVFLPNLDDADTPAGLDAIIKGLPPANQAEIP